MRKLLFIILALTFLIFSVIAILLPGLPATPFVAGSSFFAMRSNQRLDTWIKNQSFYKDTVGSFKADRSLTLKVKIKILLSATLMMSFPFFLVDSILFKLFLLSLLSFKTIYFIYFIDTKTP